jgi:hypothetical protein
MNISFVYPVSNGGLEEVITPEEAIKRRKQIHFTRNYRSDKDYLEEFKTLHWATETEKEPGIYIIEYNESIIPTGSTHLGPYGYVKQKGQFWYIFKEGGWLALSGRPMGALYPLKGETLGESTPKD